MRQHYPSVFGTPVTYWKGDEVKTRDGKVGTVIDYSWEHDLVTYIDGVPSKGFFIVTVDFGNYTEQHLRHDLSGERFSNGGFW